MPGDLSCRELKYSSMRLKPVFHNSSELCPLLFLPRKPSTVEPRYNNTNFSAIFLRYTEVSFNQGSRAHVLNIEGTEDI